MANRFDLKKNNRFELGSGENASLPPIASESPILGTMSNSTPKTTDKGFADPFSVAGRLLSYIKPAVDKAKSALGIRDGMIFAGEKPMEFPLNETGLEVVKKRAEESTQFFGDKGLPSISPQDSVRLVGLYQQQQADIKAGRTPQSNISPELAKEAFQGYTDLVLGFVGNEGKNIIDDIAKETNAVNIFKRLKENFSGYSDEVLDGLSKRLAPETDPRIVNDLITTGLPAPIRGIPGDLLPLSEKAKTMTKEEFLLQYDNGLNAQNLTVRETAQNVDDLIRKEGMTPESFYDNANPSSPTESLSTILKKQSQKKQVGQQAVRQSEETLPRLDNTPGGSLEDTIPQSDDLINLERLNLSREAKLKVAKSLEDLRDELTEMISKNIGRGADGKPIKTPVITNEMIIKAAKESEILTKVVTPEQTLKTEAAILRTRQFLTSEAEKPGITQEFIESLKVIKSHATDAGRKLQSFSINADPTTSTTKEGLVKKLLDLDIDIDKIIKASEKVDFNDSKQVVKFYRDFVPATFLEKLTEFRYINLLSSPKTHIVNLFSNLQQAIIRPVVKLVDGSFDAVGSALTGRAREAYIKEVPAYFKGFLNSTGDAFSNFASALNGKTPISNLDMGRIPTNSKLLRPFQFVPRLLEASDVYFRTLVAGAEKQALLKRAELQGIEITPTLISKIEQQAGDVAKEAVFRKPLDTRNKTGQGYLLSVVDNFTSIISGARKDFNLKKLTGKEITIPNPVAWNLPFLETPMNIFKQGIEYSPAGLLTLPGAANKSEQLAKAFIGSTVFVGGMTLANEGRLTFALPTNEKEREAFYNSGRQPYSVKIGDQWISYSKIGVLAYPLMMAAAVQWYAQEDPKSVTKDNMEKLQSILGGVAQFFSDQSYMQGLQDIMSIIPGQSNSGQGISTILSNYGSQLVPLSSLNRWVTQIVDPVFRKPTTKSELAQLIQNIEKGIPGLSLNVPAIKDAQPRQNPFLNAVSPVNVTNVNPAFENRLQRIRREQERTAREKKRENRFNLN